MNIERNVEIDKESVIDCIAMSSNKLSKLLLNLIVIYLSFLIIYI